MFATALATSARPLWRLLERRGIDPDEAAAIVWFDWLTTNIDRTPRNPNLLTWHGRVWLIDHGAAFFRQHGPVPLSLTAGRPTPVVFNGLVRDGPVVFNQKGRKGGHHDSVLKVPALDFERFKKVLDHVFLNSFIENM